MYGGSPVENSPTGCSRTCAQQLLTIEGPLGSFAYRPRAPTAAPMLLIGGGTGIAPLLSILRHVVENGR